MVTSRGNDLETMGFTRECLRREGTFSLYWTALWDWVVILISFIPAKTPVCPQAFGGRGQWLRWHTVVQKEISPAYSWVG